MSNLDTPFALAVASLGSTPEAVTAALREKGVKGYRHQCSRCPVANYLKACGFPDVTVSSYANRYNKSDDSDEAIYLSQGVRDWILMFDRGEFQEFYQQ